jgi:lipoyl-dependent peroxiredoxin
MPPTLYLDMNMWDVRREVTMVKRISEAEWHGDLKTGNGDLALGSGAFKGSYSYLSRFEQGGGTNPEELLAAAHAACFSMALSVALSQAGHPPIRVHTKATVHFGPAPDGFAISRIDLETEGTVPGIVAETFGKLASEAKIHCPVSKALAAVEIGLTAKLT